MRANSLQCCRSNTCWTGFPSVDPDVSACLYWVRVSHQVCNTVVATLEKPVTFVDLCLSTWWRLKSPGKKVSQWIMIASTDWPEGIIVGVLVSCGHCYSWAGGFRVHTKAGCANHGEQANQSVGSHSSMVFNSCYHVSVLSSCLVFSPDGLYLACEPNKPFSSPRCFQ